jgi:hypothetical protein
MVLPLFLAHGSHGAQVAQLVEQRTENPRVGGSIPPLGTITDSILKFFNGLEAKSVPLFGTNAKSGTLLF